MTDPGMHPISAIAAPHEAEANLQRALLHTMAHGTRASAEAAFAQFYDASSARAFALARRIVGAEAAEDVLEETYWQVWRDASRYSAERGVPMAWLLTICRSRALDWLRRQENLVPLDEPIIEQAESSHPEPSALLESLQNESAIHQAIRQLQPMERQLIACAYFRDMSHSEIAVHCQMPIGSVKTVLHRALGKLREYLSDSPLRINPNSSANRMESV